MYWQETICIQSRGRGTYDISEQVEDMIRQSKVYQGLCHLFLQHTSASLIICENADPDVRKDLETFMEKLCPDGAPMFVHRAEGPDDMPAHVRTILTQTELTIPVVKGHSARGIWQGVYLWEHRTSAHTRNITVTVHGE